MSLVPLSLEVDGRPRAPGIRLRELAGAEDGRAASRSPLAALNTKGRPSTAVDDGTLSPSPLVAGGATAMASSPAAKRARRGEAPAASEPAGSVEMGNGGGLDDDDDEGDAPMNVPETAKGALQRLAAEADASAAATAADPAVALAAWLGRASRALDGDGKAGVDGRSTLTRAEVDSLSTHLAAAAGDGARPGAAGHGNGGPSSSPDAEEGVDDDPVAAARAVPRAARIAGPEACAAVVVALAATVRAGATTALLSPDRRGADARADAADAALACRAAVAALRWCSEPALGLVLRPEELAEGALECVRFQLGCNVLACLCPHARARWACERTRSGAGGDREDDDGGEPKTALPSLPGADGTDEDGADTADPTSTAGAKRRRRASAMRGAAAPWPLPPVIEALAGPLEEALPHAALCLADGAGLGMSDAVAHRSLRSWTDVLSASLPSLGRATMALAAAQAWSDVVGGRGGIAAGGGVASTSSAVATVQDAAGGVATGAVDDLASRVSGGTPDGGGDYPVGLGSEDAAEDAGDAGNTTTTVRIGTAALLLAAQASARRPRAAASTTDADAPSSSPAAPAAVAGLAGAVGIADAAVHAIIRRLAAAADAQTPIKTEGGEVAGVAASGAAEAAKTAKVAAEALCADLVALVDRPAWPAASLMLHRLAGALGAVVDRVDAPSVLVATGGAGLARAAAGARGAAARSRLREACQDLLVTLLPRLWRSGVAAERGAVRATGLVGGTWAPGPTASAARGRAAARRGAARLASAAAAGAAAGGPTPPVRRGAPAPHAAGGAAAQMRNAARFLVSLACCEELENGGEGKAAADEDDKPPRTLPGAGAGVVGVDDAAHAAERWGAGWDACDGGGDDGAPRPAAVVDTALSALGGPAWDDEPTSRDDDAAADAAANDADAARAWAGESRRLSPGDARLLARAAAEGALLPRARAVALRTACAAAGADGTGGGASGAGGGADVAAQGAAARSRAVRALSSLVDDDPAALGVPAIRRALETALRSDRASLRSAALDALARRARGDATGAAALGLFDTLRSAAHGDPAPAVRRAALRAIADCCLGDGFPRRAEACAAVFGGGALGAGLGRAEGAGVGSLIDSIFRQRFFGEAETSGGAKAGGGAEEEGEDSPFGVTTTTLTADQRAPRAGAAALADVALSLCPPGATVLPLTEADPLVGLLARALAAESDGPPLGATVAAAAAAARAADARRSAAADLARALATEVATAEAEGRWDPAIVTASTEGTGATLTDATSPDALVHTPSPGGGGEGKAAEIAAIAAAAARNDAAAQAAAARAHGSLVALHAICLAAPAAALPRREAAPMLRALAPIIRRTAASVTPGAPVAPVPAAPPGAWARGAPAARLEGDRLVCALEAAAVAARAGAPEPLCHSLSGAAAGLVHRHASVAVVGSASTLLIALAAASPDRTAPAARSLANTYLDGVSTAARPAADGVAADGAWRARLLYALGALLRCGGGPGGPLDAVVGDGDGAGTETLPRRALGIFLSEASSGADGGNRGGPVARRAALRALGALASARPACLRHPGVDVALGAALADDANDARLPTAALGALDDLLAADAAATRDGAAAARVVRAARADGFGGEEGPGLSPACGVGDGEGASAAGVLVQRHWAAVLRLSLRTPRATDVDAGLPPRNARRGPLLREAIAAGRPAAWAGCPALACRRAALSVILRAHREGLVAPWQSAPQLLALCTEPPGEDGSAADVCDDAATLLFGDLMRRHAALVDGRVPEGVEAAWRLHRGLAEAGRRASAWVEAADRRGYDEDDVDGVDGPVRDGSADRDSVRRELSLGIEDDDEEKGCDGGTVADGGWRDASACAAADADEALVDAPAIMGLSTLYARLREVRRGKLVFLRLLAERIVAPAAAVAAPAEPTILGAMEVATSGGMPRVTPLGLPAAAALAATTMPGSATPAAPAASATVSSADLRSSRAAARLAVALPFQRADEPLRLIRHLIAAVARRAPAVDAALAAVGMASETGDGGATDVAEGAADGAAADGSADEETRLPYAVAAACAALSTSLLTKDALRRRWGLTAHRCAAWTEEKAGATTAGSEERRALPDPVDEAGPFLRPPAGLLRGRRGAAMARGVAAIGKDTPEAALRGQGALWSSLQTADGDDWEAALGGGLEGGAKPAGGRRGAAAPRSSPRKPAAGGGRGVRGGRGGGGPRGRAAAAAAPAAAKTRTQPTRASRRRVHDASSTEAEEDSSSSSSSDGESDGGSTSESE